MARAAQPLLITAADHGRTLTLEVFLDAQVEDGSRYELARGVVDVTKVPSSPHRQLVRNLYIAMAEYRRTYPGVVLCFGGGNEFQLLIPMLISGRNPDLGVVLRSTPSDRRGNDTPALAAEVVSRGSIKRDDETKREEYLAYGLLEYWIVDRFDRKVTLLSRNGDTRDEAVFRDDQRLASIVLPGFATTVTDLWADVVDDNADHDDLS
jgi:Uma2 family endonuclease